MLRVVMRRFAAAADKYMGIVPANARYKKIQEMQNIFLRDDGLLVWQKRGTRDMIGYYVTLLMTVGGFFPMTAQFCGMICKNNE